MSDRYIFGQWCAQIKSPCKKFPFPFNVIIKFMFIGKPLKIVLLFAVLRFKKFFVSFYIVTSALEWHWYMQSLYRRTCTRQCHSSADVTRWVNVKSWKTLTNVKLCYFRTQHEEATRLVDEMKLKEIDTLTMFQMSPGGLHLQPSCHQLFAITSNNCCGFWRLEFLGLFKNLVNFNGIFAFVFIFWLLIANPPHLLVYTVMILGANPMMQRSAHVQIAYGRKLH